ncbi:DUF5671 domain-containing protein [Ostreiculturibacter nitratireducens]|uniref:DUF5671 domain-containing protein n=1 Tax=Ostreiculturibacter nitratireducens TaxID=3075226 RepID=UPI0031B5F315
MRRADQLAEFVRDALNAGRNREEIGAALADAGWSGTEIATALAAYAESDFSPPVPRPRPYVSAREAFLYGLMFLALAMSAWHLSSLSMQLIDRWLPEVGETTNIFDLRRMRWSTASLIVFFPLFFALNLRATRELRRDPGKRRSTVRKWFGYVTLFLAAIGLLGDLIYVIYAFLNGDLTLRFGLKALVVAAIGGIVFLYFSAEIREDADAS